MNKELLYEKLMKNIDYSLKSILNEDIQKFDIMDYSDDDNDIINTNDISNITDIQTPDDVLQLTKNFITRCLFLLNKLNMSLDNILKAKKYEKVKKEYKLMLSPLIRIYHLSEINQYDSGDESDLGDYLNYEEDKSSIYNEWYLFIMFAIINNINHGKHLKKYKRKYKYYNSTFDEYEYIEELIDSTYKKTTLYLEMNVDEIHYSKIDFNGVCTLLSEFYKTYKPLEMYLDDCFVHIDYNIKKSTNIFEALDNFIDILNKYVDFIINNFEKYVDYTHKFDPDEYDPDTYLKLRY